MEMRGERFVLGKKELLCCYIQSGVSRCLNCVCVCVRLSRAANAVGNMRVFDFLGWQMIGMVVLVMASGGRETRQKETRKLLVPVTDSMSLRSLQDRVDLGKEALALSC